MELPHLGDAHLYPSTFLSPVEIMVGTPAGIVGDEVILRMEAMF